MFKRTFWCLLHCLFDTHENECKSNNLDNLHSEANIFWKLALKKYEFKNVHNQLEEFVLRLAVR